MFIKIAENSDGSHAYQHGGELEDGWAFWDTASVPVPCSFPWANVVVENITHPAVEDGGKVLVNEYTRPEVVSASEREITEEKSDTEPTQLDRIEAQVTYTAMMTDTLLEG